MPSFLDVYGQAKLATVFGDSTWVSIKDDSLRWLDLPPKEFLDYAEHTTRLPFDGVPPDPKVFQNDPSFLICQAHRAWLTLRAIDRHLPPPPLVPVVLDLGAYPFAIDRAIRDFLKRTCRVIATFNQSMAPDEVELLDQAGIELIPLNLDPLVQVCKPLPGMTDRIPLEDESVDLVIFSHVIEHLYHPRMILEDACRVLKKGGKLLMSTDNAFLIGGFLNYLTNGTYLHEPVEGTAAMVFHEWRGHVRFYSEADLQTLLGAAGAKVIESSFCEVLYNSLWERYFVDPFLRMPQWRVDLLSRFPEFRNELIVVGEKA